MNIDNTGQPIMAEQINRLNKITVLNIIRREKEISRAEIVKKSGLSAPTVTRIVDSLIHKEGLAVQVGMGESSGGRPPMIVKFNGDNNFVIGIDWGRTHLHGIISNLNGETIINLDVPVNSDDNFTADLKKLTHLIDMLMGDSGIDPDRILGIGVAVAGFVNQLTHEVEYSPNFGWNMVDVREALQKTYRIPIWVDNVSRVMALGELCYGVGSKYKDFIFINIGYGLGSGIIVDGKPFTGFDGFSGEIGHNKVATSLTDSHTLRKCVCGKTGCLESYASGRGIAETVKQGITARPETILHDLCKGNAENITTQLVAKAAQAGDGFAKEVLEEAAVILGVALANMSNTLNPQAIIIGGKVALSGSFFVKKIQQVFEQETLPHVNRRIQILKSPLIGEAAVKGAVALILKEVLDLNVKT